MSRSPGGDSRIFLNNCIGCHSGMDPMTQAFAYYDYDETAGRMLYTPGVVQPKYFNNKDTFPSGYSTPDDSWDNYWRKGRTRCSAGTARCPAAAPAPSRWAANSPAAMRLRPARCEKVFKNVCFRDPGDAQDRARVHSMIASFKASGYQLKQVFAEAASYCMGD